MPEGWPGGPGQMRSGAGSRTRVAADALAVGREAGDDVLEAVAARQLEQRVGEDEGEHRLAMTPQAGTAVTSLRS